jgi:hypothetical protein
VKEGRTECGPRPARTPRESSWLPSPRAPPRYAAASSWLACAVCVALASRAHARMWRSDGLSFQNSSLTPPRPSARPHIAACFSTPFLDVRMETIAGLADGRPGHADGVGAAASFCNPRQLSMRDKHTLLIADSGSHKIRQIDLRTGIYGQAFHFIRDSLAIRSHCARLCGRCVASC